MTPARRTLTLLVLLAACGGGSAGGGDRATAPLVPTSRDSAGVTILEHPGDALERAPLITIDSVPLATFAGDVNDPEKDVSQFAWPVFTGRGDLVGFDTDERQMLVLHVMDGSRARFGRGGAGPGEFGYVSEVLVSPGDTLFLKDQRNARVAIATPERGVLREVATIGVRDFRLVGGDARALIGMTVDPRAVGEFKDGPVDFPLLLVIWHPGADSGRVVKTTSSGRQIMEVKIRASGRSATAYSLAFGSNTTVTRWGDDFLVGHARDWALERWDTTGALKAILRISREEPIVTNEMVQRFADYMADLIVRRDSSLNRDSVRSAFATREHADRLAPYAYARTAPGGTIWVVDYPALGDSSWSATGIAPDGRILGRIEGHAGRAPIAWGDDRLAFKAEDSDGIATITVRRLHFNTPE